MIATVPIYKPFLSCLRIIVASKSLWTKICSMRLGFRSPVIILTRPNVFTQEVTVESQQGEKEGVYALCILFVVFYQH